VLLSDHTIAIVQGLSAPMLGAEAIADVYKSESTAWGKRDFLLGKRRVGDRALHEVGRRPTSSGGGPPTGSTTVGTAGNPADGATGGRIDGTVTQGPAMQGDDAIRKESSEDSEVDKKIKSICKGC